MVVVVNQEEGKLQNVYSDIQKTYKRVRRLESELDETRLRNKKCLRYLEVASNEAF